MPDLLIILLIISVLASIGIFGFFIIRDLLFLIQYFSEQREIKIYNKNYKKYQDEKKKILDKRLEREKELKEEYGLDYIQQQEEEIIVGFIAPQGKHSQQEFERNYEKYSRIAKAAQEGKSIYWRTMIKIAHATSRGQGRSR
jgi:hypothetical protein